MFVALALFVSLSKTVAQVVTPIPRDSGAAVRPQVSAQDTTKRVQEKKPLPQTDIDQFNPRAFAKSPGTATPGGVHFRDFRQDQLLLLTPEVVDSLSRLYPQLKDYILQQAIIQSALRQELADAAIRKQLAFALGDLNLPGELEAKLRRNQALYGTSENPMKPPPSPYQVNIFDAIIAITNLLHYLGVK